MLEHEPLLTVAPNVIPVDGRVISIEIYSSLSVMGYGILGNIVETCRPYLDPVVLVEIDFILIDGRAVPLEIYSCFIIIGKGVIFYSAGSGGCSC